MKRIAIVRLSALGDVIVSASVLGGLRLFSANALSPKEDLQIDWFVDERFSGVLEDSPCVDCLHSLPFKKWLKSPIGIYKIWRYMRSCGKYDAVIDMQGLLKSALVGKFLRSKKFMGFSARGCREGIASVFYTHRVDIAYHTNILVRNFLVVFGAFGMDLHKILKSIGLRLDKDYLEDLERIDSALKATKSDSEESIEGLERVIMNLGAFKRMIDLRGEGFGINAGKLIDFDDKFLAHKKHLAQKYFKKYCSKGVKASQEFGQEYAQDFGKESSLDSCPKEVLESKKFLFVLEASIEEKTYPIDKYCTLARMLQKHYGNITIYVIWNEAEGRANEMISLLKSRQIRAIKLPKLDFNNIKFVLKNMDIVIGGDTGVAHLAWAIWQPCSIALLGNSEISSGKNMRQTRLKRVLLGNPFVISQSGEFEIASIAPDAIFECVKAHLDTD